MKHLKELRPTQEALACEQLNANKVYFSEKVLTDHDVKSLYNKLCMVLDIYDVEHELKEGEHHTIFKTIKPIWQNNHDGEISGNLGSLVRYIGDNKVLMTNCAEYDADIAAYLKKQLETAGYEVKELSFSSCTEPRKRHDRSWAYINFIQTSKVVIVPMQHAEEDKEALRQIRACFPHLSVIGVNAKPFFSEKGEFVSYSHSIKEQSVS